VSAFPDERWLWFERAAKKTFFNNSFLMLRGLRKQLCSWAVLNLSEDSVVFAKEAGLHPVLRRNNVFR